MDYQCPIPILSDFTFVDTLDHVWENKKLYRNSSKKRKREPGQFGPIRKIYS